MKTDAFATFAPLTLERMIAALQKRVGPGFPSSTIGISAGG